ncbi:MAG TPA: hypothetical protein DEA58_07060 [Pseudothermotoga sp.]|nr:MAG: Uncharacterized protein XD56_0382 [Pseudothermotoga lettingae]HBT26426.1 hypothetical protein [Pseudothermotoga sp.]
MESSSGLQPAFFFPDSGFFEYNCFKPNGEIGVFFVDRMLGKLAKKLRLLGFDTMYINNIKEEAILQLCQQTGRILITRDKTLHRKAIKKGLKSFLINSEMWRDQLVELSKVFDLRKKDKIMMRCSLCNVDLVISSNEQIRKKVPLYVQETQDVFYTCPICGRVYWEGTHVQHIFEEFRRLGF